MATRELAPQLVEAAFAAFRDAPGHSIEEQLAAAITSADAHRAPQVRAAVDDLIRAIYAEVLGTPTNIDAYRNRLLRIVGADQDGES